MNVNIQEVIAILVPFIAMLGWVYHRIDKKFEATDNKIDSMDKKFEAKLEVLDKKFEAKLDGIDKKFEAKFDHVMTELKTIQQTYMV